MYCIFTLWGVSHFSRWVFCDMVGEVGSFGNGLPAGELPPDLVACRSHGGSPAPDLIPLVAGRHQRKMKTINNNP